MAKEGKKKDKAAEGTSTKVEDAYGLAGPGSGSVDDESRFTIGEHTDELLLITPRATREVTTTFGTNTVTEADVVVLNVDKPAKSAEYPSAWIFAKIVQSQLGEALKNKSRVVGTLIQDAAMKKSGQDAPYRLTAPSDSDIDVAKRYLDALNPLR